MRPLETEPEANKAVNFLANKKDRNYDGVRNDHSFSDVVICVEESKDSNLLVYGVGQVIYLAETTSSNGTKSSHKGLINTFFEL